MPNGEDSSYECTLVIPYKGSDPGMLQVCKNPASPLIIHENKSDNMNTVKCPKCGRKAGLTGVVKQTIDGKVFDIYDCAYCKENFEIERKKESGLNPIRR